MKILTACLIAMLASACVHAGNVDTKCLTEKPLRLTEAEIEALSSEAVKQILANNEDGARRCGWKASR